MLIIHSIRFTRIHETYFILRAFFAMTYENFSKELKKIWACNYSIGTKQKYSSMQDWILLARILCRMKQISIMIHWFSFACLQGNLENKCKNKNQRIICFVSAIFPDIFFLAKTRMSNPNLSAVTPTLEMKCDLWRNEMKNPLHKPTSMCSLSAMETCSKVVKCHI